LGLPALNNVRINKENTLAHLLALLLNLFFPRTEDIHDRIILKK